MCLLNDSLACCFHSSLIRSDGAGDVIQRRRRTEKKNRTKINNDAQNKSSFSTNWRMAPTTTSTTTNTLLTTNFVEQRNSEKLYISNKQTDTKELETASKSYLDVYNENNNNNNFNARTERESAGYVRPVWQVKWTTFCEGKNKEKKTFWSVTSSSLVDDFFSFRIISEVAGKKWRRKSTDGAYEGVSGCLFLNSRVRTDDWTQMKRLKLAKWENESASTVLVVVVVRCRQRTENYEQHTHNAHKWKQMNAHSLEMAILKPKKKEIVFILDSWMGWVV